jgi:hypothetical protein
MVWKVVYTSTYTMIQIKGYMIWYIPWPGYGRWYIVPAGRTMMYAVH